MKYPGFALVQVSIVLACILLMIVLAVPQMRGVKTLLVRSELEKIYSMLIYAQRLAIATHQEQVVTFDLQERSYCIDKRCEKLPQNLVFGFVPGTSGPPAQPVGQLTTPITFQGNKIRCTPEGTIQPGTVYLMDTSSHTMYALSCAVSQLSYMRMYRFDGTWVPLT